MSATLSETAKLCLWVLGAMDDLVGWGYMGSRERMLAKGKSEFDQLCAGGFVPDMDRVPDVLGALNVKETEVVAKLLRNYWEKRLPPQQEGWVDPEDE